MLNGVFAWPSLEWGNFSLADIKLHEMSDNQVLATLRYHGKYAETGNSIDAQGAYLWSIKDGKTFGFQQYVDTKQLDDAMAN